MLKKGGVVSLLTVSPSSSRGGDVLKKGGIVSLLTVSPSSSRGGDVLKKDGLVSLLTASLSLESNLVKPLLKEGIC